MKSYKHSSKRTDIHYVYCSTIIQRSAFFNTIHSTQLCNQYVIRYTQKEVQIIDNHMMYRNGLKEGVREQLNRFGDLAGSFDVFMELMVLAPFSTSMIEHSLSTLCLSSLEQVHQMQAYLELAASMPHAMARNFQSAPRYSILNTIHD